jgi:hypothetical protein
MYEGVQSKLFNYNKVRVERSHIGRRVKSFALAKLASEAYAEANMAVWNG